MLWRCSPSGTKGVSRDDPFSIRLNDDTESQPFVMPVNSKTGRYGPFDVRKTVPRIE